MQRNAEMKERIFNRRQQRLCRTGKNISVFFVTFCSNPEEKEIRVHPRIAAWPDVKGLNPHAALRRYLPAVPTCLSATCRGVTQ
jgi:hypothetical protein